MSFTGLFMNKTNIPSVSARSLRRQVLLAGASLLLATGSLLPLGAAAQSAPLVQLPDFSELAERVGPSVVNIRTTERRGAGPGGAGPGLDPNLQEFFRRFGIPIPGQPGGPRGGPRGEEEEGEQRQRGVGSGFVLSADGFIMTNAHVIDGADEVIVTLTDKRELKARVIGADRRTDVAVVKIDAIGLPFVKIGDVNRLKVGEWVMAIGSPFGLDNTVTAGIVSAKQRDTGDYLSFIQTDVAINPGNSGGPLFDAQGRVVGVNAQIWSRSGGFQGLAFAIPIEVALHVKDQIVHHGKVEHARLGVTLQDLSAPLAASFGMPRPDGALVADVAPGSAAAKAGLKSGDVITAIDGQAVVVSGDLSSRIGLSRPGQAVTLRLWRDGKSSELEVRLGSKAEAERLATRETDAEGASLGLSVRPLAPQERRQAGLQDGRDGGLLIQGVQGPAQWAGVQPGDVLLAVNGRPVERVEQVREVLRQRPKQVALLLARDGQRLFVPVVLG